MKILPDENLPHELRPLLMPMHDVYTVAFLGWTGTSHGALPQRAAPDRFDAVITTDRGYEYQHNLQHLPYAAVLLLARTNKIDDVRQLVAPLLLVLDTLLPYALVKVHR